ncbi:hypothetical protein IE53DRAFT_383890 [Violaceomyces palustris]|uniref:Uncharacterized protein n=1 Tax=Violaceomyces palustris TaxID=1673888 RepID=A0ACD0P6B5_9BASI|nr:hypothetical protein IE53DRAFT_383890 [Violaceomyces palustris]
MSSSKPSTAIILPISDLRFPRDQGRKVRLIGFLTSFDVTTSFGVLSDEGESILIDLSLVLEKEEGESRSDPNPNTYPPSVKSKLTCVGYLERFEEVVPLPEDFKPDLSLDLEEPIVRMRRRAVGEGGLEIVSSSAASPPIAPPVVSFLKSDPSRSGHVLKVIMMRPCEGLDLGLWNEAIRSRSQFEWERVEAEGGR